MTRVLVIDDDDDIRFVIKLNLEAAGYEVVECGDGIQAMDALGHELPDVIVCDIMMPGLDGYGVLEQLRGQDETASIPLLFLSAKGADQEVWQGWQSGADYYLTKPFDPDELLNFIQYIEANHMVV